MQKNVCAENLINVEAVGFAAEKMPQEASVFRVSELFRIIGDTTRTKIICALSASEMCVCDIAALLNMTSSAISHQLYALKKAGIVVSRRNGKAVYYSLADKHVEQIFKIAFEHITEE